MEPSRLFFDPSAPVGSMPFLGYGNSIFQGSRKMMVNMEEGSRMRPFFSSPDDLFDEEYYDEQSSVKKHRLTSEQAHMLEKSFEEENKLEPERKIQLAKKLGLQSRQVAVWFQNRRVRWKTKQLEKDYDILKSSYDSLLSDYESMVMENIKLKFEVISLTEKLQYKETAGAPIPADMAAVSTLRMSNVEVEDRPSCGSAVVDEDVPQLVDCGDSFPGEEYLGFMVPSKEDNRSYYSGVFAATTEQQNNEGEMMKWWVWS